MTMAFSSLFKTLLLLLVTLMLALASDEEGMAYLAENAENSDVTVLPSGLQYKVLKAGEGSYHPAADAPCKCHYKGTLLNGKQFDSSYDRGEPTTFAPNQVIKGWTEAMQLMVEGDKWEMTIPSELAYGESGAGADIPPNSVLIFEMEIIEIMGDKVEAFKCDPATGDKCNEKETKYIDKIKSGKDEAGMQKELDRLNGMKEKKMAPDLQAWLANRIYILNQMVGGASGSPEEEEEL